MNFIYNDGGRAAAGYKGRTGDCVVRAIAIATCRPYQQVYDDLSFAIRRLANTKRCKAAKRAAKDGASPRKGVNKKVYKPYLEKLGWQWTPTMFIGKGCQVHLDASELPAGRIITRVSRHMVAMVDGVVNDTYDCSRAGNRCVYGYFRKL